MLLELDAPPDKVEAKMVRLILPDFMLLFLVLAIAGNAAVILSGIVKFPQVLLLVPAISILAIIFAFVRFYGYLSTVLRVMGALSAVYDELGGGKARVRIAFPAPILLFGFLSEGGFSKSTDKVFSFLMKSDSAKYQASLAILVDHGYKLDITVTDWRNQAHSRQAEGKLPKLQNAAIGVVEDIRRSVLESKGVPIQRIVTSHEGYLPQPVKRMALARKPAIVPAPPRRVPTPPLPPVLEKKAVEQKRDELRAKLSTTRKKSEKEALQDVLYQLEEIDKVIKSG